MTVAVSTITQTGQITLPKSIRDILGVGIKDQVALLSDGERVEVVAVPKDPLTIDSKEAFLARVAQSNAAYTAGAVRPASELTSKLRERYGL